ncbi:MAG: immunoglobulin domain-containing protein, partial [Limisphaerales bacterium]
ITQHPLSHNVLSGNPVRLLCSASGTPPLSYQWFKDGVALPPTQNHPVHFIPSTTRSHSGTYWCAVTDANGTTISSNAIVQVKAPQVISNVLFTNGQFVFTSSDSDGGTITESHLAKLDVLVSTNLLNWEVLTNSLSITNGTLRLLDPEAANSQERFYRIRENW